MELSKGPCLVSQKHQVVEETINLNKRDGEMAGK